MRLETTALSISTHFFFFTLSQNCFLLSFSLFKLLASLERWWPSKKTPFCGAIFYSRTFHLDNSSLILCMKGDPPFQPLSGNKELWLQCLFAQQKLKIQRCEIGSRLCKSHAFRPGQVQDHILTSIWPRSKHPKFRQSGKLRKNKSTWRIRLFRCVQK